MGRSDGRKLKHADPMYTVGAHIMNQRIDALNMVKIDIPVQPMHDYLREQKKQGHQLSHIGLILAAFVRTVAEYPQLNRFIVNKRLYAREQVVVSMVVLQPGTDDGETESKMYFNVEDDVYTVQQKIDENGNLVLVAFGQAGAVSDSPTSANAARNKAKMQAMAAIREFAGESVAVATDALNAESVEEFENAAESYEDVSAYSQKINAVAESLKISGIATIKNWDCKHPLTGSTVYGAVCAWSPDSAARAQAMKRSMDAAAAGVGTGASPKPVANPNGSLQGQGTEADEDAF